ncbi:hypothetical protein ES288_A04G156200v1 [Gossypium darwinii]|uniref:Protein kinase domain-containing protein n=2 Tax=Gossypium TaxID=3633 RepID=A0A5D2QZF6_GOSTO|nr:hypothetical protein ES288_A04G156200v1 [Gossypium darwinii]TYI33746.1 hypothetical protein ES332_A04G155500v1 [Gossypium tomentosum]
MAYKSTNASITVVADGSNPVGSCLPPPPVAATVVAPPPHASRDTNSVAALITISVFVVLIVISLCICCFCCRRLWRKRQKAIKLDNDDDDKLFGGDFQNGMGPNKFPFMEIDKMTSNFKGEKLGGGGFGAVYRGYVRDLDTLVAVQQIAKASKQGIKEYTSEVKIISRLRHKNLVKLIGWCHKKGELVLVYEFMANGGLDSHLFKGKTLLTLVTIAYYIGISKLATKTSKESDVYSFGVVALEVAYGRRSIEPIYEESQASLIVWVRDLLCMDSNAMQVEWLLMIGLWCVHPDRSLRPSIRQVIQVLNFEALLPELPRTRSTPIYDMSTASRIQASESYFSTVSITFPR